jgi:hypothetical protein
MNNASRLETALARLIARLKTTDAEFPDECWRIACAYLVPYEALADAYDDYCRSNDRAV